MELRQLIYFKTVAEHLHFNRAAQSLNISQPPLSRQIQQLEEEIGVKLFKRNNRSVELTDAGEYFQNSCNFLFNFLNKEIEVTKKIHTGELGRITLGFTGSAVYEVLPLILREMKRELPTLEIVVEQHTTSQLEKLILNGYVNVGILVPPVSDDNLEVLTIFKEDFVLALPINHKFANRNSPINVRELSFESFIMTRAESGKGYYDSIINLCKDNGFTPNIVQTAQEQQTIISLVAAELGVAIVPESTMNIRNKNVVYLPLNQKHQKTTALSWHKDSNSSSVKILIETIQKLIMDKKI